MFDVCAAATGLAVLWPVMLILGCWIRIFDRGPAFFVQQRMGLHFTRFNLIKFRTMVPADTGGQLITRGSDDRITPIGHFLRRFKLDELPQLVNVLRGEMSIVGPRPEVPKYVARFEKEYAAVLSVRPGLTDYAAIEYCDEETVLDRFADADEGYVQEVLPSKIRLYRKYLQDMSFSTDLKIIFQTLRKIFV